MWSQIGFDETNINLKTPKNKNNDKNNENDSTTPLQLDQTFSEINNIIKDRKSELSETKKTIQTRFIDGVKPKVFFLYFIFHL